MRQGAFKPNHSVIGWGKQAARKLPEGNALEKWIAAPASSAPGDQAPEKVQDHRGEPVDLSVLDNLREQSGNRGYQREAIDPESFARLRSELGDVEVLHEIIDVFLKETAEYLQQARQALASRDHEAVRRAAHTVKGSCWVLGATAVADLSARLEEVAISSQLNGGEDMLAAIEEEFEKVKKQLQEIRNSKDGYPFDSGSHKMLRSL